jgi:hypothetical protein
MELYIDQRYPVAGFDLEQLGHEILGPIGELLREPVLALEDVIASGLEHLLHILLLHLRFEWGLTRQNLIDQDS